MDAQSAMFRVKWRKREETLKKVFQNLRGPHPSTHPQLLLSLNQVTGVWLDPVPAAFERKAVHVLDNPPAHRRANKQRTNAVSRALAVMPEVRPKCSGAPPKGRCPPLQS